LPNISSSGKAHIPRFSWGNPGYFSECQRPEIIGMMPIQKLILPFDGFS
jgi:hypothetical protein